mmetsp:Transcript_10941/g.33856  ORF Transcript_10941/g.33856 Transcript_10941/m.33856 type:complete len:594 (-) Transcript_10941:12-1793(-)|eukprot:CAMPEP_0174853768 /NCGR_PEP_ID=MMETSP1114-20130205/29560_1 /TAXON_ID=312471 /ORGANISM="Neobodo designis, Strain CCAP 1951/1" /LENGTH=593 /DNA_ID=CAMNT_0016088435 /DNA_START=49 /DNA_END=1830 /DNA_ORIENTATION=-
MPPKKGKKGKKKEEPRVARPEPVDGDDREIAMLWEKIGAIGPNPFAPPAHASMYVNASAAVPSGPVSGAVVIPVAPPGVSSWGSAALAQQGAAEAEEPSKRAGGKGGDKDNTSPAGGGSPSERHTSSPATAQSSKPTQQDQKIPGSGLNARVAPAGNPHAAPMGVVPPRQLGQKSRAAYELLLAESTLLKAQADQNQAQDEERALLEAIAEETREFIAASETLHEEISDLEATRERNHARHQDQLTQQSQQLSQAKFEIEDAIEQLTEERPDVEALLEQKRKTRAAIAEANEKLTQMALDHVTNVKELQTTLAAKKQRLESTMTTKLRRTVEELASLTADQHAARRERAEQERERLTAELAAAEQRSRSLAAKARRLTNSTDMLRRDVALEEERRAFLSRKNANLASKLQGLVSELEALERRFATQSPRDAGRADGRKAHHVAAMKDDGAELAAVVDQQYEIILQLRRDLVALRREESEAEQTLAATQQAVMQPDASASGALVVIGASDTADDAAYYALARRTIVEAVQDMEKGFANAGRKLEDVSAKERKSLLDYLVKRVNNAVLGVRGPASGRMDSTALIPRPPPPKAATV